MNEELIRELREKAGLTDEQARKALAVLQGHMNERSDHGEIHGEFRGLFTGSVELFEEKN